MTVNCPLEDQECEAFHQWLDTKRLKHHHCANESQSGRRDAIIRNARNKRLGQSKGFLDYIIRIPNTTFGDDMIGEYDTIKEIGAIKTENDDGTTFRLKKFPFRIVVVEMKRRKGGRLSPEQKQWLEWLESAGTETFVAKGADEAIRWIEKRL